MNRTNERCIQFHEKTWNDKFYGVYKDSQTELNRGYRRQNNNKG